VQDEVVGTAIGERRKREREEEEGGRGGEGEGEEGEEGGGESPKGRESNIRLSARYC